MTNKVELGNFIDEINHRLHKARRREQEKSRTFAHHFNVFDYLNTREQGLSLVLADLFNPIANHGQGTLFLREFLQELKLKFDINLPDFDANDVDVRTEETISKGRRIDIYITIKESFCLAIENKPYAKDQDNQIGDYLKFLEKSFPGPNNFLLIYLSPDGSRPEEYSLSSTEYENWEGHFVLMAYHSKSDLVKDDFRIPFTLSEWLGICKNCCKVDRLRWYLEDLVNFCAKKFGGKRMTTDIDTKELMEIVFSDSGKRLETVRTITEYWPDIERNIYLKFADKLIQRIKEEVRISFPKELELEPEIQSNRRGGKILYFSRKSWKRYQINTEDKEDWNAIGIVLPPSSDGDDVYIGVYRPKRDNLVHEEEGHWDALDERLKKKFDATWNKDDDPHWHIRRNMKPKYRNWRNLLPEIHKELNGEKTDIIDYYTNEFLQLVKKAVPIINDIELAMKS